jgi:cytochrome P450
MKPNVSTDSSTISLTVPGPNPRTRWENIANLLRFSRNSIGWTRQLFQTYGPIVSLRYGGGTNLYSPLSNCPGTVFVYGPEFVRQVATQHDIYYKHPLSGRLYQRKDDSPQSEPLKHFIVGLFGVNQDIHRQQRQLIMPAFHKQQIEQYRDDIVDITRSTLQALQTGTQYDISQLMRLLTLRIATKTLFGEDIGEAGGNTGQLLQDALALLGSPLLILLPLDLPGLPYHRFLKQIAQLDDKMREMIAKKRSSNHSTKDVLSLLIQARDQELGQLSEDELLGHASAIFAAGHETSANALTWTLFLLSQHSQVAADLVDELDGVLQGEAPTVAQLAQLPLLDRVIKESMRVLSPVPWNGRVTSQVTELGGYTLPQGTEVFVSITQTHHMPELYSQPELFKPERWETITPDAYEYNPFSAGPRLCIGAGFAMMEIKLVLAMLLQQYRLQLLPNVKIDQSGVIVMFPKTGMPMQVHPQDQQWAQNISNVRGNIRELVQLSN